MKENNYKINDTVILKRGIFFKSINLYKILGGYYDDAFNNEWRYVMIQGNGFVRFTMGEKELLEKDLISKVRKESIEFERERIKKILPEKKSNYFTEKEIKRLNLKTKEQQWAIRAKSEGYNQCINEILKEL